MSDDGTLQIADFGLAIMHDATIQLPQSENRVGGGTLRWMVRGIIVANRFV